VSGAVDYLRPLLHREPRRAVREKYVAKSTRIQYLPGVAFRGEITEISDPLFLRRLQASWFVPS